MLPTTTVALFPFTADPPPRPPAPQVCPMKNLQEYAGIDATRLERMERRLKEDVLAEAGG